MEKRIIIINKVKYYYLRDVCFSLGIAISEEELTNERVGTAEDYKRVLYKNIPSEFKIKHKNKHYVETNYINNFLEKNEFLHDYPKGEYTSNRFISLQHPEFPKRYIQVYLKRYYPDDVIIHPLVKITFIKKRIIANDTFSLEPVRKLKQKAIHNSNFSIFHKNFSSLGITIPKDKSFHYRKEYLDEMYNNIPQDMKYKTKGNGIRKVRKEFIENFVTENSFLNGYPGGEYVSNLEISDEFRSTPQYIKNLIEQRFPNDAYINPLVTRVIYIRKELVGQVLEYQELIRSANGKMNFNGYVNLNKCLTQVGLSHNIMDLPTQLSSLYKSIPNKFLATQTSSNHVKYVNKSYLKELNDNNYFLQAFRDGEMSSIFDFQNYISEKFEITIDIKKLSKYAKIILIDQYEIHPLLSKHVMYFSHSNYNLLVEKIQFVENNNLFDFYLNNKRYLPISILKATLISKGLDVELRNIESLIEQNMICDYIIIICIKDESVEYFISENSLIFLYLEEITNEYILKLSLTDEYPQIDDSIAQIILNAKDNKFKTDLKGEVLPIFKRKKLWIKRANIEYFLLSEYEDYFEQNQLKTIEDPYQLVDFIFDVGISDEYPVTKELFYSYIMTRIRSYSGKLLKDRILREYRSFKILYKSIEKEIIFFNQAEIERLLTKILEENKSKDRMIVAYINYVRKFHDVSFNKITVIRNDNKHLNDMLLQNVYTTQEWFEMLFYAIDIQLHIEEALKHISYARWWFYYLFHFSSTWRKTDILTLPKLTFLSDEEVDQYYESIVNNNTLMMNQAYKLVNLYIEFHKLDALASKNNRKNYLVVGHEITVPLAVAMVIIEKKVRENGDKTFLKLGKKRSFNGSRLDKLKNLKASRTMQSLVKDKAIEDDDTSGIQIYLNSIMRAHKIHVEYLGSNNIPTYLYGLDGDGDLDSVSFELHRRGSFGYILSSLLKISKADSKSDEITNEMIKFREKFSLLGLEAIGDYHLMSDDLLEVSVRLNEMSPEAARSKLLDLAIGKNQAVSKFSQCLLNVNECSSRGTENCLGCKFNIPTTLMLSNLQIDIQANIDNLKRALESSSLVMIKKHQKDLFRKLSVIIQLMSYYSENDKEFLKAFVELDELRREIDKLKEKMIID